MLIFRRFKSTYMLYFNPFFIVAERKRRWKSVGADVYKRDQIRIICYPSVSRWYLFFLVRNHGHPFSVSSTSYAHLARSQCESQPWRFHFSSPCSCLRLVFFPVSSLIKSYRMEIKSNHLISTIIRINYIHLAGQSRGRSAASETGLWLSVRLIMLVGELQRDGLHSPVITVSLPFYVAHVVVSYHVTIWTNMFIF